MFEMAATDHLYLARSPQPTSTSTGRQSASPYGPRPRPPRLAPPHQNKTASVSIIQEGLGGSGIGGIRNGRPEDLSRYAAAAIRSVSGERGAGGVLDPAAQPAWLVCEGLRKFLEPEIVSDQSPLCTFLLISGTSHELPGTTYPFLA